MDPEISIDGIMDYIVIPLMGLMIIDEYIWIIFKNKFNKFLNGRFCFYVAKHSVGIVFIISSLFAIWFFWIKENRFAGKSETLLAEKENLIYTLTLGVIASSIFYFIQDWIPNFGRRKARKKFVLGQMNEIYRILNEEIYIPLFFRKLSLNYTVSLEEYVNRFIENDLFEGEKGNKNRYLRLKESVDKIQVIVKEVLSCYGTELKYDQLKKLEYLKNQCYIIPMGTHALVCNRDGELDYDIIFLKKQAIIVYKAFEVVSNSRFRVPVYQYERDLDKNFNLE